MDLDRLEAWAEKWQKRFNTDKCKVMHMGRNNASHPYILNGKTLGNTDMEKANKIMGCIKRGIDARDENIVLPLYKSLVRQHMEYCVQFWSPVNKADIAELERVQRRATKVVTGIKELQYPERLSKLGLFTLEKQ